MFDNNIQYSSNWQLLDEIEQNIVIWQWWADQLCVEAEGWGRIDLQDTDNALYFAITKFNNCFIFDLRSPSLFSCFYLSLTAQGRDVSFLTEKRG